MQQRRKNDQEIGGADIPQAFPDESPSKVKVEKYHRRKRNGKEQQGNGWIITFVLLTTFVLVASYFLVSHHEKLQLEHLRRDIIHDEMEPLSREWEEKYSQLEDENLRLKKEAQEYTRLREENENLMERSSHANKLRGNQNIQIEQLSKYKKKIQENLQLMSKTALLEKFGAGPHHVEITVAFDPEFPKKEETDDNTARIVIEMAPVEEMPHSVYWFLEQVNRNLYDGCSFHRNAGHVVQGGPAPNFLSPPNPQLHKRFKDSGFNSILFQEYSDSFPHKKYTMGLAGRPGGPDFYFSTKDNTRLHGPGGQTSYEDPTGADPCFAKVIEGIGVIDRMQLSPLKPGGYKAMVKNVAIISMRILPATE